MPFSVGCVNAELGSVVTALVLDIAKLDGLVDLSLKPELVGSASTKDAKKKRRRNTFVDLKLYQRVKAVVEIVKENYLVSRLPESSRIIYDFLGNGCFHVLSVPEYSNAIGYASTTDYNTQKLPRKHFVNGQR
ncbi:hypothetical protein BHE74_00018472 [Ensete ventricosum]|nr:hypothetical protein GW17_00025641 [Ensete ventricosum]RWW73644.1 hypothetical protein BHE74_00018472 [Ensete ventricosum]